MNALLRSLVAEPKVADPPPPYWLDGLLMLCVLIGLSIEGLVRSELVFKPVALCVIAVLSSTVLIRRSHPLLAVGLMFGAIMTLDIAALIAGRAPVEVYSGAFVLILVYSVFRWGSGKQAVACLAMMTAVVIVVHAITFNGLDDLIGGTLVFCFPAAVGVVLRYRRSIRTQKVENVKLIEREQLARDLHDTVAHHVSAIVIQAQAGQVLSSTSPEAAVEALSVIEEQASRTLTEMRAIVHALRDVEEGAEHAPQRGVQDITALADAASTHGPHIDVEIVGDVTGLASSLDAGVYRLAQESITNALRHANGATSVQVRVVATQHDVSLSVIDDGAPTSGPSSGSGWGLVGMAERAQLLGGTLTAGPRQYEGWQVQAVLPRDRSRQPTRA